MKQRKPRDDQVRDQDAIRRYEMASDIDGDAVIIHVHENTISLHESSDVDYTSPKFLFMFRDEADMVTFCRKIEVAMKNRKKV